MFDLFFSDAKFTVQLSLLPYLIPPKGRTKLPDGTHWKYSITETLNAIAHHVKVDSIKIIISKTITMGFLDTRRYRKSYRIPKRKWH